jgi:hypothetical protein
MRMKTLFVWRSTELMRKYGKLSSISLKKTDEFRK